MKQVRIYIADDHKLFREGLSRIIETEKEFKIVGEADDGKKVLDDLISAKNRIQVDVLVLDINLPEINGIKILYEIKKKRNDIKVLILSMYDDEAHILQAFNAGADGYTIKTMGSQEIIRAIKDIINGEIVVPRSLTSKLISGIRKISQEDLEKKIFSMLPREIEILQYLAQGLSNKEIAFKLQVKEKTIKNYLNNIFVKLSVTNRTQAVLKAIKLGLISGE